MDNKDIIKLASIYRNAQMNLINIIAKTEARGNVATYQKALLTQINEELALLEAQTSEWVNINVPKHYNRGVKEINSALTKIGVDISGANAFAGLHTQAIELLIINANNTLMQANAFVGRMIQDKVRQESLNVVTLGLAQGETVRQMKNNIVNAFVTQGISAIRKSNGAYINLDAYGELVARSTTREATNRASINQLKGFGYNLVKISSHSTTCPICAPLQGRVYSIDGMDPRYPTLEKAFKPPYANIHVNCRHTVQPYIENLAENPEKDREFSNAPFDIDPRSKAERDRYNKAQEYNQELRRDRLQYQRYKLELPDEAPKTFSAFRRMKLANSDKYKELVSKYRSVRIRNN